VPLPGISEHHWRQPLPFLITKIVPIQAIIHPHHRQANEAVALGLLASLPQVL